MCLNRRWTGQVTLDKFLLKEKTLLILFRLLKFLSNPLYMFTTSVSLWKGPVSTLYNSFPISSFCFAITFLHSQSQRDLFFTFSLFFFGWMYFSFRFPTVAGKVLVVTGVLDLYKEQRVRLDCGSAQQQRTIWCLKIGHTWAMLGGLGGSLGSTVKPSKTKPGESTHRQWLCSLDCLVSRCGARVHVCYKRLAQVGGVYSIIMYIHCSN